MWEARESRHTSAQMSQEQYDPIPQQVIWDGRQEFNRQRKEVSDITESLIAQAKLQQDQQEDHECTCNVAKATYNDLAKLKWEVEAEIVALKGQAEGQGAA